MVRISGTGWRRPELDALIQDQLSHGQVGAGKFIVRDLLRQNPGNGLMLRQADVGRRGDWTDPVGVLTDFSLVKTIQRFTEQIADRCCQTQFLL